VRFEANGYRNSIIRPHSWLSPAAAYGRWMPASKPFTV